jgi:SAM-dependent methyltransferase
MKNSHYKTKYFNWQKKIGMVGGKINADKFARYINPNDVVLDFGCGGGYLLGNLSCKKKIGVEINPVARKEARKNKNLEIHSSIKLLKNGMVDKVISNHALEHTKRPIDELVTLQRVLKKTGKIVLVTPIDDYRNNKRYVASDINNHLYTWNSQLLGNCLKEAGFKNIKIEVLTHAWPPMFYKELYNFLPQKLFDLICWLIAVALNKRQLIAVASK